MKRKMRKFLLTLCSMTLMLVTVLGFGVACKKDKKDARFTLSQSEAVIKVNGDALVLTLYDNGAVYDGQISWVSEDTQYVEVYHGYVSGKQATVEPVNVKAIVNADGETHTALCAVTVQSQLMTTAPDNLVKYAGSGNIDIYFNPSYAVAGAKIEVTSVTDENGADKSSLLGTEMNRPCLNNGVDAPLSTGVYYVTYTLSKGDVSETFTRSVKIKGANSYEDILLLDAVDGTEDIQGLARVGAYSYGVRHDKNPGEYVVYGENGNTGATSENGINQNVDEFTQSLQKSGYDGALKAGVKGYDTTYRMYARNDSTSRTWTYFYMNLYDSANPVWTNLGSLPKDAVISVWTRTWFKGENDQAYRNKQSSVMILYKNMPDGPECVKEGGVRSYNADGGWTNYRIPVSTWKDKLTGAKNFAFQVEVTGENDIGRGEYMFELYSLEITFDSSLFATTNNVDLTLAGSYSGVFDSYDWRIVNRKDNTEVMSGTDADVQVTVPNGMYDVEYTLKKAGKTLSSKYTRSLHSGFINDFTSIATVGKSAWGWTDGPNTTLETAQPVGLPQGYGYDGVLTKTEYISQTQIARAGRVLPAFKATSLFDGLDALSDNDYVGLWMYYQADTAQILQATSSVIISEGSPHSGESNPTTYKTTSVKLPYLVPTNVWAMLKIPVSTIRGLIDGKPTTGEGKTIHYDTIGFDLRGDAEGSATNKVYYYSMEFYRVGDENKDSYSVISDFSARDSVLYKESNGWGGMNIYGSQLFGAEKPLTSAEYQSLISAGYKGSLTKQSAYTVKKAQTANTRIFLSSLHWNTELINRLNSAELENAYLSMWLKADQAMRYPYCGLYSLAYDNTFWQNFNQTTGNEGMNNRDLIKSANNQYFLSSTIQGTTFDANTWVELKISLKAYFENLTVGETTLSEIYDTKNLVIELDLANTVATNIDIYSLEIVFGDLTDYTFDSVGVDTNISSLGAESFAYTMDVYNAQGDKLTAGTDYTLGGSVLSGLAQGNYTLVYSVTGSYTAQFTRKLNVTSTLNDCTSTSTFMTSAWQTNTATIVDAPQNIGVPNGLENKQLGRINVNNGPKMVQTYPCFTGMSVFFDSVESLDDNDYIGVWMYFESTVANNLSYLSLIVGQGRVHAGGVTHPTQALTMSPYPPCNEWTLVKFYVSDIKEVMAKSDAYDYDSFGFEMRFIDKKETSATQQYVYFYSVEFYQDANA